MKDVSCRVLKIYFKAIEEKKLSSQILFKDIPYNLNHLKNPSENIEWDVFCRLLLNLRTCWNDDDYINIGREMVRNPVLNILTASRLFLKVREIYRFINTPKRGLGNQYFRCITPSINDIEKNHLTICLSLPQNYFYSHEFFLITQGFFIAVPTLLKLDESKVLMKKFDNGAAYEVFYPERNTKFSFMRKLHPLSRSVEATVKELSEAYELLYERYNQIELSHTKIQNQAKEIEAIFNINRLIKSKLDLDFTLNNILNVLITHSSIDAVEINVDTIVDSEIVKNFAVLGTKPDSGYFLNKKMEVSGHKIGEINFWPKRFTQIEEIQELLDHIVPSISLEIMNAIAIKILDNNKVNLGIKVEERTNQLKKVNQELESSINQLKELQILRDRFFASISHEFRTPLTLILGPVEKLLNEPLNDSVKKNADTIKRSAIRLLGLINQLLELSKLKDLRVKLEARPSDILLFTKSIASSFQTLAEIKNINIIVSYEHENIELYFNQDKMMKILSNLISNSIKFTPEGGEIKISILEKENSNHRGIVEIKLHDNGIGIPQVDIPKLFEQYFTVYQRFPSNQEGTGIGLALTKELVELHHGTIRVESQAGNLEKGVRGWTEFTLNFLTGRDHLQQDEVMDNIPFTNADLEYVNPMQEQLKFFKVDLAFHQENRDDIEFMSDKSSEIQDELNLMILIVEDNHDVREFIKDCLGSDFQIELAADGKEALVKSEKLIPDLIISDILMPYMSGYDLTRILKKNERTSHIPIILLTAKSQHESKIEGLEAGADDYLTKPFDANELRIRIHNLVKIRRQLQDKFSKEDFISKKSTRVKKLNDYEEQFMNKILDIIEKHLGEEEFTIEQFAEEASMSRVQLHRKLKALTGKSASTYLRSVRLLKAKKMLSEQNGNVSEIAYAVGFSSPAYFTRCFKEEFNYLPSDLLN